MNARPAGEVRQLAEEIGITADNPSAAVRAALGETCLLLEDQLRQELGPDISAGR